MSVSRRWKTEGEILSFQCLDFDFPIEQSDRVFCAVRKVENWEGLVRFDFALIPDNPMFESVVNASQAITNEYYYNENIIDERTFPPHLSLHICTVPHDRISQIVNDLRALIERVDLPHINSTAVESSCGGYVMLNVERTAQLMALHEAILELVAIAREGVDADKYGSKYVRDAFVPHISLAKVDGRDLANATNIGRQVFGSCQPTRTRALELCDIGARNERWDVLVSFPNRKSSGR